MVSPVRELLSARKAEIKKQQAALKIEMQEILTAEAAMGPAIAADVGQPKRSRLSSKITLKDMVKEVLSGRPEGADSFKILDLIKEQYGKEVARASLSPQLSRLKNDDKALELRGSNWFLLPEKGSAPEGADNGDHSDLV